MSKKKKGLIRAILVIFGLTLLIVALSVKFVPEWLSIPGGVVLLMGVALNAVLEAGSKLRASQPRMNSASKTQNAINRVENYCTYNPSQWVSFARL